MGGQILKKLNRGELMGRLMKWLVAGVLWMTVGGIAVAEPLTVGCDVDFKPFVYKSAKGEITGFDIELWNALAKELGHTYRLIPMKFTELLPALAAGKIDVALAGITIRSDREKMVDFSFPYYESGLQIAVRADDNHIGNIGDLVDKTVGTKEGTSSADFLKNIQTKSVRLFPSIEAAYTALQEKTVDAVVFDVQSTLTYLAGSGKGSIKTVGPPYRRQFYGIAFQQGSPLREPFNIKLLQYMEDGWYDIVFRKWFGYVPQ
jgi:glutamine transport system substrate-binding protein